MGRHEERLVDADGDRQGDDDAQRPDCERLAVMTHGKHVLVER